MNKFIVYLAISILPILPMAAQERISDPMAPRNIQILLEKDSPGALVEVRGSYYVFNPKDGLKITTGLSGKRFMVHETENGLKWGEEFPGIHQIYIKPRTADTLIFVNGIQYAGAIAIYAAGDTIHIINDIDIEDYVKSTLTMQFTSPLEPEVMSSLAILARTDAYYLVQHCPWDAFWHIAASDIQYQGSGLVVKNSSVDKAVDGTHHLILVNGLEGTPFPCCWTENSAGKTAPYATMFRKDTAAPEKGVEAPHAALARKESKWTYQIGKKTLAHLLDMPKISSMETFVDKTSGKVYGLRVSDGTHTNDVDFITLQTLLGEKALQSSDFAISLNETTATFTGYGKGHGAGLCLYSASALAQNGDNAVKILSKFFPDTYLYNLNAIPE